MRLEVLLVYLVQHGKFMTQENNWIPPPCGDKGGQGSPKLQPLIGFSPTQNLPVIDWNGLHQECTPPQKLKYESMMVSMCLTWIMQDQCWSWGLWLTTPSCQQLQNMIATIHVMRRGHATTKIVYVEVYYSVKSSLSLACTTYGHQCRQLVNSSLTPRPPPSFPYHLHIILL